MAKKKGKEKSATAPTVTKKRQQDDVTASTPPSFVTLRGPSVLPPNDVASNSPTAHIKCRAQTVMEDEVSMSMLVATPVLTGAECQSWIDWGESGLFSREAHAATKFIAHRDSFRVAVQSAKVAEAIFDRLKPLVPATMQHNGRTLHAVGCNANIRLYKYERGQRFGPHVDGANVLPDRSRTEFTVLIYLNNAGLKGGSTAFYEDHPRSRPVFRFAPVKGAALIHAHGDRCLTHEAEAVVEGRKYVLRTDLAYKAA